MDFRFPEFFEVRRRPKWRSSRGKPIVPVRRAYPGGAIIQPEGIIGVLCTPLHKGLCPYIRNRIRPGESKRKAGPLLGGGSQRASGSTITILYYRGEPERIPQMGDFFLARMGDFFAEGMCFDTSKEGEGGAPTPRSPIMRSAKRRAAAPYPGRCGSSGPQMAMGRIEHTLLDEGGLPPQPT